MWEIEQTDKEINIVDGAISICRMYFENDIERAEALADAQRIVSAVNGGEADLSVLKTRHLRLLWFSGNNDLVEYECGVIPDRVPYPLVETYLCQICARLRGGESQWRKDVTENEYAGNVCPSCMKLHEETGLTGEALRERAGCPSYLRRSP